MVFGTGGYGPIGSSYHARLWGVTMPAVHQKPLGLHQLSYHGVPFLRRYKRNAAGWYTWKYVAG